MRKTVNGIERDMTQEELDIYNSSLPTEVELLNKLKLVKIGQVDTKTKTSILAIATENKQRSYLAKYNELLEKKVDGTITADETTVMADLKALWASIETLVSNGNARELEIQAIVIDSAGTYPTYADAVAALDAIVI